MDLPWGDERAIKFITNVGLVTSTGAFGDNIMACEWTHHISYSPGLIAVCIGKEKATTKNIMDTKEFGVSLCAIDQSVMASISGGYTGKGYDKISALRELGFKFYKAKNIKALMVKDAAINVECKLVKEVPLGDHIMFIGEVLTATNNPKKEPLAYHKGRYWIMDKNVEKPSEKQQEKIKNIVEKYKKLNEN